jgi:hypothetical protein
MLLLYCDQAATLQSRINGMNAPVCAGLALLLGVVINTCCLQLGYPVSALLSGQNRALLERLTLELR